MHTLRVDGKVFLWNLSTFLLHSAYIKIFPGLYNFRNFRHHNSSIRVVCGHASCVACHPLNLRGTSAVEIPVSFLLLYTSVLPVVFLLRASNPSSMPRTQLMRHFSCLLWETGLFLVMPPTQFTWHVERVFKSILNNRNLSDASTPVKTGAGNNDNEGVYHATPKLQDCSLTIRRFTVICGTFVGGVLTLCRDAADLFYSLSILSYRLKLFFLTYRVISHLCEKFVICINNFLKNQYSINLKLSKKVSEKIFVSVWICCVQILEI